MKDNIVAKLSAHADDLYADVLKNMQKVSENILKWQRKIFLGYSYKKLEDSYLSVILFLKKKNLSYCLVLELLIYDINWRRKKIICL